jgi:hypothetical protein
MKTTNVQSITASYLERESERSVYVCVVVA